MDSRQLLRELVFLAVTASVIGASLTLYLAQPGVPLSHEGLSYLQRVAVYADHFRHGDFFPIWASQDAHGMGTPQPLFYHKTFYYLATPIALLLGSVQGAIPVTLAILMLVGAYGMRAASGKLTSNFTLQVCGAQALLLSNYSFTDWFVRGAMAEFSVFMLVPWLAWWCLGLVKDGRFSFAIVPILYLMVQAHNITALFGMIALCIAMGIFLGGQRLPGLARIWRRALACMALFWLLLAPPLVLQAIMLGEYDPSKITQQGYQASAGFLPPMRYLHDSEYVWLANWMTFTPQIDIGIWMILQLLAAALAIRAFVDRGSQPTLRGQWGELSFLACAALVFVALQLKFSSFVYEGLPPLQFLQFPWRLLVYITVFGLLLVVAGLDRLVARPRWLSLVAVAWAGSFAVLSPLVHDRSAVPFLSQQTVDDMLVRRDPQWTGTVLQGQGEYLPRMLHANGQALSTTEALEAYRRMHEQGNQLQVLSGSCELKPLHSLRAGELSALEFEYRCLSDALVALPVSYSPLLIVEGDDRQPVAFHRLPTDPRTRVTVRAGQGRLRVQLPSTSTVLRLLWLKATGDG